MQLIPISMFRVAATAVLIVAVTQKCALAIDVLSPQDSAALTQHLNIIAGDPGWPQASVNAANAILSKAQYTPAAWNGYFTGYFGANPYTQPLSNYIGYPVFFWFSDTVHHNLQSGLYGPLLQQNVLPDWSAALAAGGSAFSNDATLRNDLHNSQRMLADIAMRPVVSSAVKQEIFGTLTNLADQHPTVLKQPATFNRSSQPYFATQSAQFRLTMLAAAESSSASRASYSPAVKAEISDAMGLAGDYAEIWSDHSLLYLDNNLSSPNQLQVVRNFLAAVPSQLHNTAYITVADYLGNRSPYQPQTIELRGPFGGVNVFGLEVGAASENSFPNDVSPGVTDVFSIVLAHEITHVIDAYTVQGDPALAARRQELLSAAGTDSMNYLRSMVGGQFFQDAPQEFIASIANQWFTDSTKTLELGLSRFDGGRAEPLNQALFFAEIFSLGGDSTNFYAIDVAGNLDHLLVPLGRNASGHIDELIIGDLRYLFELDSAGNVTGYSAIAVPEPDALTLVITLVLAGSICFRQRAIRCLKLSQRG